MHDLPTQIQMSKEDLHAIDQYNLIQLYEKLALEIVLAEQAGANIPKELYNTLEQAKKGIKIPLHIVALHTKQGFYVKAKKAIYIYKGITYDSDQLNDEEHERKILLRTVLYSILKGEEKWYEERK